MDVPGLRRRLTFRSASPLPQLVNQRLALRMLAKIGYRAGVEVANNGLEALEAIAVSLWQRTCCGRRVAWRDLCV
jgi:hypothetical protein